jgi:hypothetical protein
MKELLRRLRENEPPAIVVLRAAINARVCECWKVPDLSARQEEAQKLTFSKGLLFLLFRAP